MTWSAIDCESRIAVKQEKTKKLLLIPIHRELQIVLDSIPKRAVTILTSANGTPWKAFQTASRKHKPKAIADARLVFHGLRKSAVVTLLEAGCTEAEVSAVTGQSLQMVSHHAKQVNQALLAKKAVLKWEQTRT